jgi:hypothetical protein
MIDETRFFLGTLCRRGHAHEGGDQSLRYLKTPVCVQCAIEGRRAADATKRIEREALCPPLDETLRRCAHCREVFPRSAFEAGGIRKYRCKGCAKEYRQDYYARNPEKALAAAEWSKARHLSQWQSSLVRGSQSSARMRGLEHRFDTAMIQELWDQQQGLCYWFRTALEPGAPSRHPMKPSLDRLDCTAGYVRGNVVLASYVANMGRGPASAALFAEVVRTIQNVPVDVKLAKAFKALS